LSYTVTGLGMIVGCLALGCTSALAGPPPPYKSAGVFSASDPSGVAAEASTGDLFIADPEASKVLKFGPEGGEAVGELTGAETPQKLWQFALEFRGIGVDSGGNVYVATRPEEGPGAYSSVAKFEQVVGKPNEYKYVCEFIGSVATGDACHARPVEEHVEPTQAFGGFGALGVAVGSGGNLYTAAGEAEGYVYEFSPTGEGLPGSPLKLEELGGFRPSGIAIDDAGDIYVQSAGVFFEPQTVVEYNAQNEHYSVVGGGAVGVTVDQSTGEVFVLDSVGGYHVVRYGASGADLKESPPVEIEEFGAGELGESPSSQIAYSPYNGDIYVTDPANNEVHVFAEAGIGPIVDCEKNVVKAGKTSALVACAVDPNGEPAKWQFEYKLAGGKEGFKVVPEPPASIASEEGVEAEITGLEPDREYVVRLHAHNKHSTLSETETFTTLPAVEGVTKCTASAVTDEAAVLRASLEPDGALTEYYFQYGVSLPGSQSAFESSTLSAGEVTDIEPVVELEPNRVYQCRIVATRSIEGKRYTTEGEIGTFDTPAAKPVVVDEWSSNVAASSAELYATVDPENSATTYSIEYVDAAHYHPNGGNPAAGYEEGGDTPVGEGAVGSDVAYHTVQQVVEGLTPGTTYHYRVVATNSPAPGTGVSYGKDGTFTTADERAPVVSTGAVGGLSPTGATLSGTVNPEGHSTSYVFEIGTNEEYGTDISGAVEGEGTQAQSVTLALENLVPLTTYYYRLSAANANGSSQGQVVTFTTPGTAYSLVIPPAIPLLSTPPIAFPSPEVKHPVGPPTRGEKLAKALRRCEKKPRRERAGCERQARKLYGPATKGGTKRRST
jgi:hypothetical protein